MGNARTSQLPGWTDVSCSKKFSSTTSFRIYMTLIFSKYAPDKPFSFNLIPSYISYNINHQNREIRNNPPHVSKKTQDIKCHLELHMPYWCCPLVKHTWDLPFFFPFFFKSNRLWLYFFLVFILLLFFFPCSWISYRLYGAFLPEVLKKQRLKSWNKQFYPFTIFRSIFEFLCAYFSN